MLSKLSKGMIVAASMMLGAGVVNGQSKSCHSAGGMLMTNLGAVDANTTMGYDLALRMRSS